MNITNLKFDDDFPEVVKFLTELFTKYGTSKIEPEQFREVIATLSKKEQNEVWEYFREWMLDGEIIDSDLEKSVEWVRLDGEVGSCEIDGKACNISIFAEWADSPYFSLDEMIDRTGWIFKFETSERVDPIINACNELAALMKKYNITFTGSAEINQIEGLTRSTYKIDEYGHFISKVE